MTDGCVGELDPPQPANVETSRHNTTAIRERWRMRRKSPFPYNGSQFKGRETLAQSERRTPQRAGPLSTAGRVRFESFERAQNSVGARIDADR